MSDFRYPSNPYIRYHPYPRDIHLPVKPSRVDEPSQFHTITKRGAHDIYKFNLDGSIEMLQQSPPQHFTRIEDPKAIDELKKALGGDVVMEPNPAKPDESRVVANPINKFFANDQKVIDVFKMIGSTFRGHGTNTCGHYCLLTNLALLSERILESDEIVQITFTGLTELTLNKFQSTTDDKDTEKANREKLIEWLTKNQEKLCNRDTSVKLCFEHLIGDLKEGKTLHSDHIKLVIKKATELTGKEHSVLDPEIVNIQQAVNVALTVNQDAINVALTVNQDAINDAEKVTPDNAKEKLDKLKESQKLQAVFSLEGVTTDDVLMIGFLTSFLTVFGGPGIAITAASLLLFARTARKFNVQVPSDDEIKKIIRPEPEIENPKAQRVIPPEHKTVAVA